MKLDRTLQEMYDDLERAAIARAMEQSRHNQADTARLLGITRKGLYLKRRRLGLDDGRPTDAPSAEACRGGGCLVFTEH